MGNHIKHRRLFRLATSCMLAVVLAGGGVPVLALHGLFETSTAYAEEQQQKVPTLEVDERNSSQDSAREIEVEESQHDQDDVLTVVEASDPAEDDVIAEEDAKRILATQNSNENEPSISFEGDVPNCLVVKDASDSVDLTLSTQNTQGLNIRWTAGLCVVDDWVNEHVFVENREYSIDHSTNTITLNGAKVLEHLGGYGEGSNPNRLHVRVFAEAIDPSDPDGNPVATNATTWVDFFEPYVAYENREQDRDMLPGWDGTVYRWYNACAYDVDHPYGENRDYEVMNVSSSDESIVTVERQEWGEGEDADHNWRYEAKDKGTATLTVTYQKVHSDETDSYTFDVTVTSDVYDVEWDTENTSLSAGNGSFMGLPGQSILIRARGIHHHEGADDSYDGFAYAWALADDGSADRASITDNADGTATVTYNPDTRYENDEFLCTDVNVQLTASKDGKDVERTVRLDLENEYPEIWINETDSTQLDDLEVGATQDVTPEVRFYVQDWSLLGLAQPYTLGKITRLNWDFDNNAISITYNNGTTVHSGEGIYIVDGDVPTFSITRLGNWDTEIHLHADWEPTMDNGRFATEPADKEGDTIGWRHEQTHWNLRSRNYGIRFDGAPDRFVASDEQATEELHLDWDSIMGIPGLQIVYTVGIWDGNDWAHRFTKDTEYTVDYYRNIVTLNGTEILKHLVEDEDELTVRVLAEVKNGDTVLSDTDHWIRVLSAVERYDQDQECDLLPGWEGTVDNRFNMWVRNEDHPEGEDFECIVTDVKVTTGANLIDFDSNTWHYRAKELGTATLEVTYQRPDNLGGGTGTYNLKLNIVADEYHFEGLGTQRHGGFILPGETADVWLQGYHQHAVKNENGTWRIEESTDDLAYEWEMVPSRPQYDNIATMTVDENDPTHVTISAMVLEREPRPGAGVTVSAHLKHNGEGVARAGWTINICDSFPNFEPTAIDCDLGVGESTTIDTKLMWRECHDDGKMTSEPFEPEDLQLFWSYDTDAIRITDADGNVVTNSGWGGNDTLAGEGPYTVTRLNDRETMLCLTARWPEGNSMMDCEAQYRFVAARNVTAHKLTHVAAKRATLSATGHKEHWKCKACGKLFLDEDATQITTLKDVTIAKLINISTAAVTVPAAKYTGRAQHVMPTVKVGGKTLVEGTDYKVSGNVQTNARTNYTMTIAGIGLYGGSKSQSYSIAKAASTISLANQTKTYTGKVLAYTGPVKKSGSTGTVTYAYYSDKACTKAISASRIKNAGTYYVKGTVKADANHKAATSAAAKFTIAQNAQTISATAKSVAMGKTVSLGAKVTEGSGTLSYKSSATSVAKVSARGIVTPVKVGTTTIIVTAAAKGNYKTTSKAVRVRVTKGAQPLTVKARTAKVALAKVKKANQTLAVSKVLTIAKAQGAVTYTKVSGNAKITVNSKTGAVTVKKGIGKGTYPVKIRVKAAGNANWKAGFKTVTFKVYIN